jgi:hypothetical protein
MSEEHINTMFIGDGPASRVLCQWEDSTISAYLPAVIVGMVTGVGTVLENNRPIADNVTVTTGTSATDQDAIRKVIGFVGSANMTTNAYGQLIRDGVIKVKCSTDFAAQYALLGLVTGGTMLTTGVGTSTGTLAARYGWSMEAFATGGNTYTAFVVPWRV